MPNAAADTAGIGMNARWIRDRLRERGVRSELLKLPGANPIVYGEINVPDADRTVAVYVHYDGQPVDPSRWLHDPWSPTLYTALPEDGGRPIGLPEAGARLDPEWRLFGRSAGDDKAPIAALLAALDGLQANGLAPTTNVRFFFDGEEEAGSPNLGAYLEAYRDRLDDIDIWLFCDGPVHQSRQPQVVYGVRGVTGMEITTYGPARPLHSGHYGNWAPVPGRLLAQLLASMYDDRGNVAIEGFYDSTAPVGEVEREALAALPDVDAGMQDELGIARPDGNGESLPARLLLPSLTIRGLESANVGALARNVIPSTATAALGIRLVAGNDPEAMLDTVEAHIRAQGFHVVYGEPDHETLRDHEKVIRVSRRGSGYVAARAPMDLPVAEAIVETVTRATGEPPLRVPSLGGSLPLYLFTEILGKPAIILPIANHDNNQHAEN
jgi:acetylornithine deacetylase/succinyl-diaminopimelate desuccinylase-like protein